MNENNASLFTQTTRYGPRLARLSLVLALTGALLVMAAPSPPGLAAGDALMRPSAHGQAPGRSTISDAQRPATAPTGWQFEEVDFMGQMGLSVSLSLGLDSSGSPHISYWDNTPNLKHAYRGSGGWELTVVDGPFSLGGINSLAVDSAGYAHIGYEPIPLLNLKYAHQDAGGWQVETVDDDGFVGSFNSLDLDSANLPHLTYLDTLESELKYAFHDGGGWNIEMVGPIGPAPTSLAVDSTGHAHVSYLSAAGSNLIYALRTGGSWQFETVDSDGNVGVGSSLALDGGERPHISYYDDTNHNQK